MTDPVWAGVAEPEIATPSGTGWVRVAVRAVPAVLLIAACFLLKALLRLFERPLFGMRRPVTPWLTVLACRGVLRLIGLRCVVHGRPVPGRAAQVANHASWLDILVLNAPAPIYFVSKAEVSGWPGIGWLARAAGTVFIERDRRQARKHTDLIDTRLMAGHQLLFFPEGTSTDGLRVLPFKTTLFAAFLTDHLRSRIMLQPVTVVYHAPAGQPASFYGWWGRTGFAPHLLRVLAAPRQGRVDVMYHPPLLMTDFSDRKLLASVCEAEIRTGFERLRASADSLLQ